MPDLSFAQLVALVAPAGALVGIFVGRHLSRNDAHEAWLREKRLEAYAAVIQSSHTFWEQAAGLMNLPEADEERERLVAAMRVEQYALDRLTSEVQLLGSKAVSDALRPFVESHRLVAEMVRNRVLVSERRMTWRFLHLTPEGEIFGAAQAEFAAASEDVIQRLPRRWPKVR